MGSVQFNKQNNRLGRAAAGEDHISGLLAYCNVLPSGLSTNSRMLELNSQTEANNAGLKLTNVTDPLLKNIAYHVQEFYRIRPNAKLFIGFFPVPSGAYTFAEATTLRLFAVGKIRQMAVYNAPLSQANVQLLQSRYADAFAAKQPFEILLAPEVSATAVAALPDLSVMLSPNVHVIIGQDGAATGNALFMANPVSVSCLGAALGAMALAKVNENIGWVEKFNMALVELEVPALSNGVLMNSLSDGTIAALEAKRYIFLKKYTDVSGTYFNDSHGCCPVSDDYAFAEDNRAMDKAIRGIYKNLVPKINGPVLVDASSGKLAYQYCEYLKLEAGKALEQMEKDEELSGYTVTIDPDQDVNATSTILIEVTNEKVGVSRNLVVNIGY